MSGVLEIAGVTRAEGAIRAWTKAVDRAQRLETEAESTFAEMYAAQQGCASEGMTCDLELSPGIAAAFSEWKQRQARQEARELVP